MMMATTVEVHDAILVALKNIGVASIDSFDNEPTPGITRIIAWMGDDMQVTCDLSFHSAGQQQIVGSVTEKPGTPDDIANQMEP